jgi:hypothetical protein
VNGCSGGEYCTIMNLEKGFVFLVPMETIEIRLRKILTIPMIIILSIGLIGMIYYVYFSGRLNGNQLLKWFYVLFTGFLVYAIYIPARKLIKNEPAIILSKETIGIIEKVKPKFISWAEVIAWKIEKSEDGYFLIIQTHEKTIRTNISWLEKTPGELEQLIGGYKGRS